MFEVNGTYANRKGKYTVLSVEPPRMTVRYEDGSTAELNMAIQERIWENIQSEEEARAASRRARERRGNQDTRYFIKSISMIAEEDLSVPGWRERVIVVGADGPNLRAGDRILFYAVEDHVFFAVATVTGPPSDTVPKGFFYSEDEAGQLRFYPIDLDEHTYNLDQAVELDQAELESVPNHRKQLQKANVFLQVDEDDFELIAELLTEITEEEDEDFEDEEEEEEDYDE
ncbi:MAG: hypothetical protein ACOC9C_00575 [Chloroflexota bacterium]